MVNLVSNAQYMHNNNCLFYITLKKYLFQFIFFFVGIHFTGIQTAELYIFLKKRFVPVYFFSVSIHFTGIQKADDPNKWRKCPELQYMPLL